MKTLDVLKFPEGFFVLRYTKGREEFLSRGELNDLITDLRKTDRFAVRLLTISKVTYEEEVV